MAVPSPSALGVPLQRAAGRSSGTAPAPRGVMGRLLGIPLAGKLAGANALLAGGTLVAAALAHRGGASDVIVLGVVATLLALTVVANVALVHLALRPIVTLERTADRVWRGDYDARVPVSPLADRELARVGETLTRLLDGLLADRARLRRLAAEVLRAGEAERARIAHELHDSTAQTLAALKLQLAALGATAADPDRMAEIGRVKDLASVALEEVRTLALTVHPRVLDDLGLGAALEGLARETQAECGPEIEVIVEEGADRLPRDVATVLFGVAREALANALRYANASRIELRLTTGPSGATMEVVDDGSGFDVTAAERRRSGLGLFSMRERVALADGRFQIASVPHGGTRVLAAVPYGLTRE